MFDPPQNMSGYQQIGDLSAAVGLEVPDGATGAIIVAEGQDVRYRFDGTAPTATVGMPLAKGVLLELQSGLSAVRFIQASAMAKLNVLYFSTTFAY